MLLYFQCIAYVLSNLGICATCIFKHWKEHGTAIKQNSTGVLLDLNIFNMPWTN